MKYKLIALDVDGTLLNDDYIVTEKTKQAIREVRSHGAVIVLCTGRGPISTIPVLRELGYDGTLITHNGAATVYSQGKRIIHQYPFRLHELSELIAYCRKNEIHFDVCTPFEMYVEKLPEKTRSMYDKYMAQPLVIDDVFHLQSPVVKFSVFAEMETVERVERDWKNAPLSLQQIRSGDYFIDVMRKEANKGNALGQLSESLGIDRSEILAIGNYYNDIEMIRLAGLGIAMENSPEEVKRAADTVTLSNNEDGVYWALHKYCLKRF